MPETYRQDYGYRYPKARESGKVIEWLGGFIRPEISGDTELLADVTTTTDKGAKVVIQMPEIAKAISEYVRDRSPEIQRLPQRDIVKLSDYPRIRISEIANSIE